MQLTNFVAPCLLAGVLWAFYGPFAPTAPVRPPAVAGAPSAARTADAAGPIGTAGDAQDPMRDVVQEPAAGPGHTVLVVEGTVRALGVTAAVAKPDPWAGVPKGLQSAWSLAILAADGRELARVPLDLSPFDTDPRRIGQPVSVEGCIVRDSRIVMLVNVPNFAAAARYVFEHRGRPLGEISAPELRRLVGGGK